MTTQPVIDENKLNEFVEKFVGDLGAVMHAATVLIGDKLGLYRAMADGEPITAAELAERTGTDERYMREWLSAQAASGYAEYNPATERFRLSPEQAFALTDEYNPLFVPGGLQTGASMIKDADLVAEAIRTGRGVGWHEHHHDLFEGAERFFRPNYIANLVGSWIPALDGVEEKLRSGAKVADIGRGHGASTIILAREYPGSTVVGFDYHEPSIAAAREAAAEAGVADRCAFEVASAEEYPGEDYDLVAVCDALHDMGDPVGVAAHVRETLAPDGAWMIVEPYAGDRLEDNLTPVGRAFYSASTTVCVPASKDQEVGLALGAQAGEALIREVVTAGGFGGSGGPPRRPSTWCSRPVRSERAAGIGAVTAQRRGRPLVERRKRARLKPLAGSRRAPPCGAAAGAMPAAARHSGRRNESRRERREHKNV